MFFLWRKNLCTCRVMLVPNKGYNFALPLSSHSHPTIYLLFKCIDNKIQIVNNYKDKQNLYTCTRFNSVLVTVCIAKTATGVTCLCFSILWLETVVLVGDYSIVKKTMYSQAYNSGEMSDVSARRLFEETNRPYSDSDKRTRTCCHQSPACYQYRWVTVTLLALGMIVIHAQRINVAVSCLAVSNNEDIDHSALVPVCIYILSLCTLH